MKIRYLITLLRTLSIPGLFPIMRDWESFVRMHFIHAALESGLLEALRAPCSREQLMGRLAVKRPELLDALLDVGLSLKELAYENGLYRIRGKRSKAVTGRGGDVPAAMVQAHVTYYSSAYRHTAERLRGAPLGKDLEHIGGLVARFAKIGEPLVRHFIADIVTGKNPMRILDVGCGSGVFLKSTLEANPNATGVGMDVDGSVVEQAGENMKLWGLSERFRIIAGDIRLAHRDLKGPFDLIALYNVVYYFSREERSRMLKILRPLAVPGGVLALVTHTKSEGKDLGAANLNLVNSSFEGLTPLPSLEELTGQLRESGFGQIKIQRLIPGSAFYGIRATASGISRS